MLGVASMPTLLTRAGTAPGVFEARKSMAWAAFLLGVILLTLPAIAVFARYLMLTEIVGKAPERLPEWLLNLFQIGPSAHRYAIGQGHAAKRDAAARFGPARSCRRWPACRWF